MTRAPLRITAALLAAASAARADVYVGTAFHIRDLVARPDQWADVRADATGYYFHPRSGNEASELKGTEQRQVTGLFAHPRCITERNNGGDDHGDTPQYDLMRACGMTPVAGLVAEVNTLEPWVARVKRSSYAVTPDKVVDVPLVADQRPWTSAWNKTADLTPQQIDALAETDAELKMRMRIMTAGAGFALETDNSRSSVDGKTDPNARHLKICEKMLGYAKSRHKTTMLFLHGFETADPRHYVEANLGFLRALEDAKLYPDVLICSFYTPESPVTLLPETAARDGRRVPQDTLTGLAWAALAREGAIPLRDDERPHVSVRVNDRPAPLPAAADASAGPVTLTLRLDNPNPALDFAPAVTVQGGAKVEYAFEEGPFAPLAGDAVPLLGEHRLTPGSTRTLRLRVSPGPGETRIALRHHAFASGSPSTELATVR